MGEVGVGKIVIVEGLVYCIVNNDVLDVIVESIVYFLDLGGLLVGIKYCGDFEKCLKVILKELLKDEYVILFIDEIYIIIGVGVVLGGVMDVFNLFKFKLFSGELCCIGLIIY